MLNLSFSDHFSPVDRSRTWLFDRLLKNCERIVQRLSAEFNESRQRHQLLNVAASGKSWRNEEGIAARERLGVSR
jgi:hypothetical protein